MSFLAVIDQALEEGKLPTKLHHILTKFYATYDFAITKNGHRIEEYDPILLQYFSLVLKYLETSYHFELFHHALRKPLDYYHLGIDMLRPLVIFERSKVIGHEQLKRAEEQ